MKRISSSILILLLLNASSAAAMPRRVAELPAQAPRCDQYESLESFLLERAPAELHLRGGQPAYPLGTACSLEEAEAIVRISESEGLPLTVEQIQLASPWFRTHDSPQDRFLISVHVVHIAAPVAAFAQIFALGCLKNLVVDFASHGVWYLTEGFLGTEIGGHDELLWSCVAGGLTGGIVSGVKAKAIAKATGVSFTAAIKYEVQETYRAFLGEGAEDLVKDLVFDKILATFDTSAAAECGAFLQEHGTTSHTAAEIGNYADCVGPKVYQKNQSAIADLQAAAGANPETGSSIVPQTLYVTDGTYPRAFIPASGGMAHITYGFIATKAGSVTTRLYVNNEGLDFALLSPTTVIIDSSNNGAELQETLQISSEALLALHAGNDARFKFTVQLDHSDGFSIRYEGDRSGGVPVIVDTTTNLPVILSVAATDSGNIVQFNGTYADPEGQDPTSMQLQLQGPSPQTVNLLPLLQGTATEKEWSSQLFVPNGIYTYRVTAVQGGITYQTSLRPLRISSTPPVVTLQIEATNPSIGDQFGGTVQVTDANGGLPGVRVSLSCNGGGPFRDAFGTLIRNVVTNSSGNATFFYEVTTSGSQSILAMEESHQYDFVDFEVAGNNDDVCTTFEWFYDGNASTDTVAVYDVDVFVQYPCGTNLDPGDYVYFEANHGTFQWVRDQTGTQSRVDNTYILTKEEADSGSEIVTLRIPEYDVETTRSFNLPVGGPSQIDPSCSLGLTVVSSFANRSVDVSPDGTMAARCQDTNVTIYDLPRVTARASFSLADECTSLSFSPDSSRLVAADDDGGIKTYTIATGAIAAVDMTSGSPAIEDIHWYAADGIIAGTSEDPARAILLNGSLGTVASYYPPGLPSGFDVQAVRCSSVSNLCAASSDDATWYLFTTSGSHIHTGTHPDDDDMPALAFSSDGSLLLVG